uniref:TlpA disulfide reductase family protein n=1 Tax=Pedobacter schmidteae TaxID=2201271 RepID=UPI000EB071CC|nr:TlpA disulfide reductase family protein [Pedobacter schmidteae]
MKKYFATVIAICLTTLVFAQQKKGMVTVKGTLNGDLKGHNMIYMYTRTSNDSTKIKNGHYTFSFPFSEAGLKMLYPKYLEAMGMAYQPFGILIAGPGTYYVTSDISKGMTASELKGPEPMVLYNQFNKEKEKAFEKVYHLIAKVYGKEWYQIEAPNPVYERLQKSTDSLQHIYVLPALQKLLKQHPDSYASAYLLSDSRQIGSVAKKEQLYHMLSARMQKSDAAKKYKDYIQGLKSANVGSTVANFVLPDPAGQQLDFARLKGKYVLIDFWASWCVPCRQSFPHMGEVYKKYKSDKFEIYSISIDEDKSAWLKAVKEENNPWLQSLDTKNISQKGFAVTAVPSTFLIDPQGKIIAKEIGFDPNGNSAIEKKINEVLSSPNKENKKSIPTARTN